MKISAVIIACDEEEKIGRAIRSVAWADEILVVDSGSVDATREIASSMGARVIVNDWSGFADQKQFATDAAANDWIFSLDADEEVTDELRDEIDELRRSGAECDGYRVPRLSYYMGRPIRHGGWYPDRQLRFFDRRKGRWLDTLVHESVAVQGSVLNLSSNLLHFSVEDAAHHHRMIGERYAPLAARQMYSNGKRTSLIRIAFSAPAAFIRGYILKLGILDGIPGLAIAGFGAHHAFLKHLMLYELQNREVAASSD